MYRGQLLDPKNSLNEYIQNSSEASLYLAESRVIRINKS